MAPDVAIRCACGALEGRAEGLGPGTGNRLVCYCDDCQSFAWALEAAERVLDAHGGTDIFQTSPARVSFTKGQEHLACLRLREKGLLRWYASCCNTALANTNRAPGVPFVGLIHCGTDCGGSRDAVLGPSRGGVFARFAKGDRAAVDAADKVGPGMAVRVVLLMLRGFLRGDARRSPFFADGRPVVAPRVLEAEELARVEAARGAHA